MTPSAKPWTHSLMSCWSWLRSSENGGVSVCCSTGRRRSACSCGKRLHRLDVEIRRFRASLTAGQDGYSRAPPPDTTPPERTHLNDRSHHPRHRRRRSSAAPSCPASDPMGFFMTIVARSRRRARRLLLFTALLGIGDTAMFDLGGLLGAIIGVMILLGIYRVVAKPDRSRAATRHRASHRRAGGPAPGLGEAGAASSRSAAPASLWRVPRTALLALAVGLVLADSSVVTLGLPDVLVEFDATPPDVAWVLTGVQPRPRAGGAAGRAARPPLLPRRRRRHRPGRLRRRLAGVRARAVARRAHRRPLRPGPGRRRRRVRGARAARRGDADAARAAPPSGAPPARSAPPSAPRSAGCSPRA